MTYEDAPSRVRHCGDSLRAHPRAEMLVAMQPRFNVAIQTHRRASRVNGPPANYESGGRPTRRATNQPATNPNPDRDDHSRQRAPSKHSAPSTRRDSIRFTSTGRRRRCHACGPAGRRNASTEAGWHASRLSYPLLPLSLLISFFAPTRPVCRREEREREREKSPATPQTSIFASRVIKGKGAIAESLQGSSGSLCAAKPCGRRRKEGRREERIGEGDTKRRGKRGVEQPGAKSRGFFLADFKRMYLAIGKSTRRYFTTRIASSSCLVTRTRTIAQIGRWIQRGETSIGIPVGIYRSRF